MDVSAPSDDSVCEYVNSSSDSLHACVNHKQCVLSKSVTIEDNVVAELGNAFCGVLNIQGVKELMSGCTLVSNEEEINCQEKENLYEELELHQIYSSTGTSQNVLRKFVTFPCSKQNLCPVSLNGKDEISDVVLHGQSSMKSDNPACTRSISLPTSSKLVPAIKGSREKQGTYEKKLTVTWAPDVYDPPITTVSHTVKGHSQQRSRSNKKSGKHKNKGKSSRGSNSDKKQYRRYIGNSELHSKAPVSSNGLLHQSTVDLLDFAVSGQESKCGNIFLRTSLGKLHIPFAEAT